MDRREVELNETVAIWLQEHYGWKDKRWANLSPTSRMRWRRDAADLLAEIPKYIGTAP